MSRAIVLSKVPIPAVVFVVAACLSIACSTGVDEPEASIDESADTVFNGNNGDVGLGIEDIVDNPEQYAGQTVTISGEIEDTYTTGRAFAIGESDLLLDGEVLVLTRGMHAIEEGETVRVTGTVRSYAVEDLGMFESELGWDFDSALETQLEERRTVLVADSLVTVPATIVQ